MSLVGDGELYVLVLQLTDDRLQALDNITLCHATRIRANMIQVFRWPGTISFDMPCCCSFHVRP